MPQLIGDLSKRKGKTMNKSQQAIMATIQPSVGPMAVAWLYPDGRRCTLSWSGQDEVRMQEMAASHGLIRHELFAHQPQAQRTPIAGSGLSFRVMNCLLAEGFEYIEDAQAWPDHKLLKIQNFGRCSLSRLRAWVPPTGKT